MATLALTLKIRWTHLDHEHALRNENVKGPFLISFFTLKKKNPHNTMKMINFVNIYRKY